MKRIGRFLILFISIVFSVTAVDKIELSESDRKDAIKLMQNIRKRIEKEEKERVAELKRKQKEEEERQKEEARQRELAEKEEKEKQDAINRDVEEVSNSTNVMTNESENMVVEEPKNEDDKSPLEEYLKDKNRIEKEKKSKIKTPMEKLEATQKLANEKVDFYERVTRSVAREEKEVKEYNKILDLDV